MKLRRNTIDIPDAAEREAEARVRQLAGASGLPGSGTPPASYFSNLRVRTNERIDKVTSGMAISLSWLARVAVPGVVALIFFFVGLHYYAPESDRSSVVEAVQALSPATFDSLLVESASDPALATLVPSSLFEVSADQLADFYIRTENPATVLKAMSEQQLKEVAVILEARSMNL